jgi:predicted dehydrogenase
VEEISEQRRRLGRSISLEAATPRAVKVAIAGLGLIGRERLKALRALRAEGLPCECVGIHDPYAASLPELAQEYGVPVLKTVLDVVRAKPDWVVVCVPHDAAAPLVGELLSLGIKVLIEKPLGRTAAEARRLIDAQKFPGQLSVGYNFRFFAGVQAAAADLSRGIFGEIVAINMVLGHGGRPGDEKTWKLDPVKCGGGSLIDPGVHLLDLARCFSDGKLECVGAAQWRGFWKTGIEEECHLLLRGGRTVFNLNPTIVRWRSTFRIEIHGAEGYGIVNGRNRSYGPQTYVRGKRWGWQGGKSQAETEDLVVSSDGDDVFAGEMRQLFFGGGAAALKPCSAEEALRVMELMEDCRAKLDGKESA